MNNKRDEDLSIVRERFMAEQIEFRDNKQDCKRVISIPRSNESKTCWFNAILMVFFYSQNMRSMMIQKYNLWKVDDPKKDKSSKARHEIYAIFRDILVSMYDYDTELTREQIYSRFEQISPEKILFLLNDIDPDLFPINPREGVGYNAINYISSICTLLSINVAFLISETDSVTGKEFMYVKNFIDQKWFDIDELIDMNKDIMNGVDIILVDNLKSYSKKKQEEILTNASKLANYNQHIKQFRADFKTNNIRVGEDTYVKDAVFLTSMDDNSRCANHEIAGITCNDKGYIYNGWILKRTNQDIMVGRDKDIGSMGRPSLPCELMPYDWKQNRDIKFSLNKDRCELKIDRGGLRDLHFNMVHGTRNFVFVNKKFATGAAKDQEENGTSLDVDGLVQERNDTSLTKPDDEENESQRAIKTERDGTRRAEREKEKEEAEQEEKEKEKEINIRRDLLKKYKFTDAALQCIREVSNISKREPEYTFDSASFNPVKLMRDLPIVSPKLALLLHNIDTLDKEDTMRSNHKFKHVIFSDVKNGFGAKMVASALIAKGIDLVYDSKLKMKTQVQETSKTNVEKEHFALLTGKTLFKDKTFTVTLRRSILNLFNKRPENVHGKDLRFLIIDESYREGIDLFDVRYMHIFEPQLSPTEEKQAIGRSTRYCGQKGLRFDSKFGWPLYVKVYDSLLPEELQLKEENVLTLHDLYMKNSGIDMKKRMFADDMIKMIVMGAVDYDLNKKYHTFKPIEGENKSETSFPRDGLTLFKDSSRLTLSKDLSPLTSQEGGRKGDGRKAKKEKEKSDDPSSSINCDDGCKNTALSTADLLLVYISLPEKKNGGASKLLKMDRKVKTQDNVLRKTLCAHIARNKEFCKAIQSFTLDKQRYMRTRADVIETNIKGYESVMKKMSKSMKSEMSDILKLIDIDKKYLHPSSSIPPTSSRYGMDVSMKNLISSLKGRTSSKRESLDKTSKNRASTGDRSTDRISTGETYIDRVTTHGTSKDKASRERERISRDRSSKERKSTDKPTGGISINRTSSDTSSRKSIFSIPPPFPSPSLKDRSLKSYSGASVLGPDPEGDRLNIMTRDYVKNRQQDQKRLEMARYERFIVSKPLESYTDPNRFVRYRQYVIDNFKQYSWIDMEFKNMCDTEKKKKFPRQVQELIDNDPEFERRMTHRRIANFTPTQNFIRHYFNPALDMKGIILNHSPGSGKCHAWDTPIIMSSGQIKMVQDIVEGDELMGDDYTPRLVYSLARGRDEMFEVEQEDPDAMTYGVNQKHILCLLCVDETNDTRYGLSDVGIEPNADGVYEIEVRRFLCIEHNLRQNLFGYRHTQIMDANTEKKNIIIETIPTPISCKSKGMGDYYGFTISGNGRYLLGDRTVTHNTCTAIATATTSFESAGYTILWVTRKDLKDDVNKNTFGDVVCHARIRQNLMDGSIKDIPEQSDKKGRAALLGKSWPFDPISYLQFSNLVSKGNENLRKLQSINGTSDPLKKTLIIIDEAHKLYGETKDLNGERHNMKYIEEGIMRSYQLSGRDSVRMILMTATPFTNEPMDMVKLINLCKIEKDAIPTDSKQFSDAYLDESGLFTKEGRVKFLNKIAGHISYLNREFDAREYAIPVIEYVYANMSKSLRMANREGIKKSIDSLISDQIVWTDLFKTRRDEVNDIKRLLRDMKNKDKNEDTNQNKDKKDLYNDLDIAESKLKRAKETLIQIQKNIKDARYLLKPPTIVKKGKNVPIDQDKSQEGVLFQRCMKQKKKL